MKVIKRTINIYTSVILDGNDNVINKKTSESETFSIEITPEEILDYLLKHIDTIQKECSKDNIYHYYTTYDTICPLLKSKNYSLYYCQPKYVGHECDYPANRASWAQIKEYKGIKVKTILNALEEKCLIVSYDNQDYQLGFEIHGFAIRNIKGDGIFKEG